MSAQDPPIVVLAAMILNGDHDKQIVEAFAGRVLRAEMAERLAEAFEAAYVGRLGDVSLYEKLDIAWRNYANARDAVQKLEGQADGP